MTAYDLRISDWISDVCSSDLDAGAEGELAILFVPDRGLDRLAVIDRRRKTTVEPFEAHRVIAAARGEQRPPDHAIGREPVQDRRVEAAGFGDIGVDVPRVEVTPQAIDLSLVPGGGQRHDIIGGPVGNGVGTRRPPPPPPRP